MADRRSVASAVVCCLLFWPFSAQALTVTFTSRSSFENALSSFDTWNFNGPQGNAVIHLNSSGTDIVDVSTQGGDSAGIIHDNALCGRTGGQTDCFSPLVFTILQPRNAFGFDNLDLTATEEAVVNVAFVGLSPAQQFVFDLAGQAAFTPTFFGFTSDQLLASVTIYSRWRGTTGIGERANVIDNVTVGSASTVPEPGTILFLGFGLLGLIGLNRRRKA